MNGLTFQPVASPWVVLAVAVLLVAMLLVRPRHLRLPMRRLIALIALRLLIVLMTLTAMLRPTLVYTELKPQPASLLLLVDSSRSMQVEDSLGNESRWKSARAVLNDSSAALGTLAESVKVRAYAFDAESRPVQLSAGKLQLPDEPMGEQTDIGSAFESALDRETSARVLGILLLSDGAHRAIPPRGVVPHLAVRRIASEGIPLYTFAFGQPGGSGRADLRMDDLVTNDTVFAAAPTEVHGQLRAFGFANQTVIVQLLWEDEQGDMQVVDTLQQATGIAGEPIRVTLRHTPTAIGEQKVTLRVETREGELITSNNEASTFVTVREGGINVLYLYGAKQIGGGPGLEQTFLRGSLAKSPDIVVTRRFFDYDPTEEDIRELLSREKIDVVVLDDLDRLAIDAGSWQELAELVRRGAGLLVLGGYHSFGPGGYSSLPVADLLPVEVGFAERQNFGEPIRPDVHVVGPIRMRPAVPFGTTHPIMQIGASDQADSWSDLPPLDGANRFDAQRLKPNAKVLAESDDAARHPLLVIGEPGSGRVLAFAGDSTWRWPMYGFADAHLRFWRQCILWLAKKDRQSESDVWIRLAARRVARGSRIDMEFGANDAQPAPLPTAQFEVEIQTPGGSRLPVRPVRRGENWSGTFRETDEAGDYIVHATGRNGDEILGTAEARFNVLDQDLELDNPAADPGLLAQLAKSTEEFGGRALAPEELPSLLEQLANEPPVVKEEVLAKVTYWDTWPFLLMFVALLGVEWYLRKRWGLV